MEDWSVSLAVEWISEFRSSIFDLGREAGRVSR